jgi:hypothetical protein
MDCSGCPRLYCPPQEITQLGGAATMAFLKHVASDHSGACNLSMHLTTFGKSSCNSRMQVLDALMLTDAHMSDVSSRHNTTRNTTRTCSLCLPHINSQTQTCTVTNARASPLHAAAGQGHQAVTEQLIAARCNDKKNGSTWHSSKCTDGADLEIFIQHLSDSSEAVLTNPLLLARRAIYLLFWHAESERSRRSALRT